ncbi:MAG: hypothetical protein CL828_00655 [Crocinitomicaceae bacterium]|nr:hypothetical protein [Crocinitomicaceae bacterium]
MNDKQRIGLTSLLSIGIYASSLQFGFTAIDDGGQILDNPFVHSLNWENIKGMFSSATVGMYQPLTTLLFSLVNAVFGHDSATPFHLLSLLLHVVNSALVYHVGKRLLHHDAAAFALSLLFAAHPLAVEAVCWVSATSTLLFTGCFLSALLAYDRFLEDRERRQYRAALGFFLLGCLAKVQILPFVGVMFLLDYLRGRHFLADWLMKLPFLFIAGGFVAISFHFRGGETAFTGDYPVWLLVPAQFIWYAVKAVLPLQLGIVYDWPMELWTAWTIFAYGGLAAWIAALIRWRKNRFFVFSSLFFFGNLILHTALATTFLGPFADRYGYVSVLGLWLAAWSLVPESKRTAAVRVGGAAAVVYAGLAFAQTQHWRSTIDLWTQNLTHETATFSNGMRGALYYESGQFNRAKRDFERVDQTPDARFEPEKFSYLYTSLGLMTTDSEPEKSLRYFKQAAQWKPQPESFENVAVAAKKLGDFETAEAFYLKCPKDFEPPSFYMNLSSLYFETQQFEKGAAIMTQAIDEGYNDILFYKMRCYFRIETGDIPNAVQDFEQAMALFNAIPNAQPDPSLNNLRKMLQRF